MGRAERQFYEAFERLKSGKTKILPKGSRVSQNNVAKEAGVDPSALRRSRFPTLVAAIQKWIEENACDDNHKSKRQRILAGRAKNRELIERLEGAEQRAGLATAKLVLAEERIVELTMENQRLQAQLPMSNVTPLRPEGAKPKR
jgi:hypothetical protein